MSGHSKWSQIKHKKGITDQKKGALFSKLLKGIAVAARDNPDPQFNPRLRTAIEKAKESNVPGENIERAVKKSSEEKNLEEVTIEAYGPEKAAIVIEGITDSKNRTVAEVRTILTENGGKMADPGSVLWAFEKTVNGWQPKFRQPLSEDAAGKLRTLMGKLEDHEDVQRVLTNAS